jgi:beta-glucuronidase
MAMPGNEIFRASILYFKKKLRRTMLRPQLNKFRYVTDYSGFWKFKADPKEEGESSLWFKGFTSGKDIAVPGSWNEQFQEEGLMNYIGSAWYSKEIVWFDDYKNKRIWLWIGSADYYAKVWLNGRFIGEHTGGFLPLCYEITEFLNPLGKNILVIKVNNQLTPDTIPQGVYLQNYIDEKRMREESYPAARFDFFPYGGIHRPVMIYTTNKNIISDITVHTAVTGEFSGSVNAEIEIESGNNINIACILEGNDQRIEVNLLPSGNKASAVFNLDSCRFWSAEDPYLYSLVIQVKTNDIVTDEYSVNVGIREIKIDGYKLLLNNKPVFLKGFGKHEDFPVTGKALNPSLIVKDFGLLKWINANSFRASHYPYAEEVLDMADKNGFLVIDEVAAISLDFRHTTEKTLENHKNAITELIKRDKNHPCVIAWALGNEPNLAGEEEYHNGSGKKYWKEVFNHARTLDNSRPFTVPNCPRAGLDDPVYSLSDFISLNRYYGWYENPGQINLGCKRMGEEMDFLAENYKKPILVTEFGADTMPGLHSTDPQMFTEEYQSEFIREYCRLIESKPYTIGEHIWNFADFRTPQIFRRVVFNLKGVFTRTRDPKAAAFMLKEWWLNCK